MRKLREFFKGVGSAGLSFVELIISVAIMGVVCTTVAGTMYVSSKSYTRGAAEVNVQEEAQLALNLISDWVMDATKVTNTDATHLEITHPEDSGEITITIYQAGDKLMYHTSDDPSIDNELCAYITSVNFNSTFDVDRNVNISLDFDINGRTYHAVTDTTSRNHDFTLNSTGADVLNLVVPDNTIVLEPHMNGTAAYSFTAIVYGASSTPSISIDDSTSDHIKASAGSVSQTGSSVYSCPITVTSTDTASIGGTIKITATYTVGGVAYSDTENITTLVRRVTKCEFITSDKAYLNPITGAADTGKAGSIYVNTVDLGIINGAPRSGAFDQGSFAYIDPSKVEFYVTYADGSAVSSSVYNLTTVNNGVPSVTIALNSGITKDLRVWVSSIHSGTNATTGTVAENKASRFAANTSYLDPEGTYVTYFDIKKGGSDPLVNVGAGFQRGANKFLIAELSNDTYNWLRDQNLLRTDGSINYVVSLRYKEKDATDYLQDEDHPFILSMTTVDPRSNPNGVFGCEGKFTSLFDCDKAYTIEVSYSLYVAPGKTVTYNGTTYTAGQRIIEPFTSEGNIAAVQQFAYNSQSGHERFESNYGTESNPMDFTGRTGDVYFSVYHDTINVKGYYVIGSDGIEYKDDHGNWQFKQNASIQKCEGVNYHSYSPNGSGTYHYQQYRWDGVLEDKYDNTGLITLYNGSVTTTKYVKGYDENKFPDPTVTYTEIQVTNFTSGEYRIKLHVNGYNNNGRWSINSLGELPTTASPTGSQGTLSDSGTSGSEDLGYIYFKF